MAVCRDQYGRVIDYLRVSVTDRCNLSCVYCTPSQRIPKRTRQEILRYEEIVRVVERFQTGTGGGQPAART